MPLVVFSHGLRATSNVYSTLTQHFASHGYIVAAIEHADGSAMHAHAVVNGTDQLLPHSWPNKEEQVEFSPAEFRKRNTQLQQRAREVSRAIDAVLASPDTVLRRVDPDRIVMCGHSFGAATAVAAGQVR